MNRRFFFDDTALLILSARLCMTLDHIAGFYGCPVFIEKNLRNLSRQALIIARYNHDRIIFP
jgi:hypothetical protein